MRKIAVMFGTLLVILGLAVSPAAAASAPKQWCNTVVADDNTIESQTCKPAPNNFVMWDYCNVNPSPHKHTFYDNQGYCGSSVQFNPSGGTCREMGAWSNWSASMVNYSVDVGMFDAAGCTGAPNTGFSIDAGYSHPNFYCINGCLNLGNKISSFQSAV